MIFEGEVIDVALTPEKSRKVKFRVDKIYKGIIDDEIELGAGSGNTSCDLYFNKGEKYVVFFGGEYPLEPRLLQSGWTHLVRGDQSDSDERRIFEVKMKQLEFIDAALAAQNGDKDVWLRKKAKHFLNWRDFQQAEVVLQDLIKRDKRDLWAIDNLMTVLYKQKKVQAIKDFLETDAAHEIPDILNQNRGGYHTEAIGRAVSLASLLRKDMGIANPILLEEISLQSVEKPRHNFQGFYANKVYINKSNFSDSDFMNANIDRSYFFDTNFSDSNFFNAKIEDTSFYRVDFSKAELSSARFLNSSFTNVNFKDAFIKGLMLTGSVYDCKTVWPEGFDPVAAGAKPTEGCK
ncbi:MAG: pentapeptide repeat-containing protein [bacterium]|nr:pentapeptide repeat-containing protein [bacterium]